MPSIGWARTISSERLGWGGEWPLIGKMELGDGGMMGVEKVSKPAQTTLQCVPWKTKGV